MSRLTVAAGLEDADKFNHFVVGFVNSHGPNPIRGLALLPIQCTKSVGVASA